MFRRLRGGKVQPRRDFTRAEEKQACRERWAAYERGLHGGPASA